MDSAFRVKSCTISGNQAGQDYQLTMSMNLYSAISFVTRNKHVTLPFLLFPGLDSEVHSTFELIFGPFEICYIRNTRKNIY